LVTDVTTGKTDGTIVEDGDIIIDGEKIKIAPAGDTSLGVFFVTGSGTSIPVTHSLAQNDPKRIICRVPMLEAGTYTLKIVTRFTSGSNKPLNEPREIIYNQPLKVG
jgi:hypothetical protein